MQEYQYTAFISYRHTEPDEAIAKKLHTLIENFGVPGDIQKSSGRKKMGRVFRDQEELPLSTDLGGDIRTALESSEWLIAVCSPRYLESRWCMTELDYFIELGRRDHILAILVEGEPDESFPLQLRTAVINGETVEVEPLAGDVRAESLSASLKKLGDEKLRLLAPMLGVRFDDLRQRARRRKRRITAAVLLAAFALLSGFLTFALIKNRQISAQNEQILQQNEEISRKSDEISKQSDEILRQNDEISKQNDEISQQNEEISRQKDEVSRQRDLAVTNEMKVMIEQANISVGSGNKLPARKVLAQAAAMRETVGNGNDEDLYTALEYAVYTGSFETVQTIDNDNRQFDSLVFSHNDKYLLGITNLNSATLIDAENGGLLHTVSRAENATLSSVGFTKDDRYFYTVDSWYNFVNVYDTETGEQVAQFDRNDGSAWNIGERIFALEDGRLLIPLRTALAVWDPETGAEEEILPTEGGLDCYIQPFLVDLSPDGQSIVMGSPGYGIGMKIRSLDGTREVRLESSSERGYSPIVFSGDGKTVAAASGNMCFAWNAETGENILQCVYASSYFLSEVLINYDGSTVLLLDSGKLVAVDVKTAEVLWEKTAESNVVTEAAISPNGKYVCAYGGIEGVFDIRNGEVLSTLPCTAFSNDGTKVLSNTYGSDPALLVTPEAATARLADSFDGELVTTPRYTNPSQNIMLGELRHVCGEIYSTPPGNANRKAAVYIDPQTKYAAYTHYDGFIETFDISDPNNVKYSWCVAEHCYNSVTDLVFNGDLMASCGGFDPRCAIFDLSTGQMVHVLRGTRYAHQCEFSPDGSKLILLSGLTKNIIHVYAVQTGTLLYHYTAPEGLSFTDIGFTADSSASVALLEDGRALIGTLYGTLDELIGQAAE
nr:TIR domain-containing protein [Lachnospiraceae bacterium]